MGRLLLITIATLLFSFSAFAEDEKPTYVSDPTTGTEYATGLVQPPLTFEQDQAKRELDRLKEEGALTYEYDVSQVGLFDLENLGYKKPEGAKEVPLKYTAPTGTVRLKPIDLRDVLGSRTPDVLNQGGCGSCVVFAFIGNGQFLMALRHVFLEPLSPQHLMNCGGPPAPGQCSGDWGPRVASRMVKLRQLALERDYRYTAQNGNCKNTEAMQKFGQFDGYEDIDGSLFSLHQAATDAHPVSVGVAADSRFSAYKKGIYNGFGSMSTNHYVLSLGVSECGSSMDEEGYCVYVDGHLKNGDHEGVLIVRNSWGGWGDEGHIYMQFENKQGKRNNNIAGGSQNAQILKTNIPVPPVGPVVFELQNGSTYLKVTVQPGKYNAAAVKAALVKAGF